MDHDGAASVSSVSKDRILDYARAVFGLADEAIRILEPVDAEAAQNSIVGIVVDEQHGKMAEATGARTTVGDLAFNLSHANGLITSADVQVAETFRGPQCQRTVVHETGQRDQVPDPSRADCGLMDPDRGNGRDHAC